MNAAARRLPQLGKTAFMLCDIQERFRPLIHRFPAVIATAKKMVDAGKALDVPLIVTEQYPKALGNTVHELDISNAACVDAKTDFSMATPKVLAYLESTGVKSAVLFGIESHVCVLQTALSLLDRGVDVHVLADGVSSSDSSEIPIALDRMKSAGCVITTSDSLLFQLARGSTHPHFKAVSKLVKDNMSEPHHNSLLKL